MPSKRFNFEQGYLEVKPIPKFSEKGKWGAILGSYMSGGHWMNNIGAIRRAIETKKSRYGSLGKPYILAINILTPFIDQEDVASALYGSEQVLLGVKSHPNQPPKLGRAKDGVWTSKKATKVSGILITHYLTPWTVATHNAILYINSWASFPYSGGLRNLSRNEVGNNGYLTWTEGTHPRQILELEETWPESAGAEFTSE